MIRHARAVTLATLACLAAAGAAAAAPFIPPHDGPGGMTCDFYDVALRVPWPGDRAAALDAHGATGGTEPFAHAVVGPGRERVAFDVARALVVAERGVPGAFLLRGSGGGERFASRDHQDDRLRPRLALALRDGRRATLAPTADATIDCSTNQTLGMQQFLRVGPAHAAILRFAAPPAASIAAARLELDGVQSFGNGSVDLYALASPVAPAPRAADSGIAAAHPGDRDLARDPDVLFAEDFEDGDWRSRWSRLDFRSRADRTGGDERNGFEPLSGHALRVTLARGTNLALDLRRSLGRRGREPEDAYFRYYLRFGDDWGSDVDGGKLPGFAGTYGRAGWGGRAPDGTNGWNMRMTFAQRPPVGHPGRNLVAVGTEASLPPQRGAAHGDNARPRWPWTNGFAGVLAKNRWYCIEQRVRLNTPGVADGVFAAWVDGELAIERHGVDYRYVPDLRIEEIWLDVYHGGTAPAASDQHLYIDNVVVARRYIGPLRPRQAEASP